MARPSNLKVLFVALYLLARPSLGASSAQKCQTALSEVFVSEHIQVESSYEPQACGDNIFYLLENIEKGNPRLSLDSFHVLIIYSRWTGQMPYVHLDNFFVPKRSREAGIPRWGYHVVLEHENRIIDFDFNGGERAIPLREYFKSMFASEWKAPGQEIGNELGRELGAPESYSETNNQYFLNDDYDPERGSTLKLHLRRIPASIFLAEHAPLRPTEHNRGRTPILKWITDTKRFPDLTLQDFLAQAPTQ